MKKNPFKYTGPLAPSEDEQVFLLQDSLVDKVIQGLTAGDYWAINGPRQIGKTTFLRTIQCRFPHAYYVYLNFELSPNEKPEFYKWLENEVSEHIPNESKKRAGSVKTNDQSTPEMKFFRFLETFQPLAPDKLVILLCDDIQKIPSPKSFLHLCRKIFHDRYNKEKLRKYAVVISGAADLLKMATGSSSPYNIARRLFLNGFSPSEAAQLIERAFTGLNISIVNNAKEKLFTALSGHPQMLQQCCHFLVQRAQEKDKDRLSNETDVDDALTSLIKNSPLLDAFKEELLTNKTLRKVTRDMLSGKTISFLPYSIFSVEGSGPIIEGPDSACVFRNEIYKTYAAKVLPALEQSLTLREIQPLFKQKPLLKKPSAVQRDFHPRSKKFDMKCAVKQIHVKNFHGIIDTHITLPVDARWIFLTGPNAYGKTAVLRALAIGLSGPIDENDQLLLDPNSNSQIAVELYSNKKSLLNNVGTNSFTPMTRFAAYGPSRLQIQSDLTDQDAEKKISKTYSLFNDDGVLLNIEKDLVYWSLEGNKRNFDKVKGILHSLLPNAADIIVNHEKRKVEYIEKECEESGDLTYSPLPFRYLAAGNKSIIAMVGDLIKRFYEEYKDHDLKKGISPAEYEGIVIIDEIDLHLHPRWLWRLPKLLSDIFPNIQFIVSTHSEMPLLGGPRESVFLKVTRTVEDGIKLQRILLDIRDYLSHHILTSPIYDLEEESMSAVNESFSTVRTETTHREVLKSDEIMARLRAFEESDEEFPDDILKED